MAIASAYIANLGKYNEGELVGGWIDLPATDEEIKGFLKDTVGINEQYEEFAIHDWESDYIEYPGEYASIWQVNNLAEKLDELDEDELKVFKAASEIWGVDIDDFDAGDYWLIECNSDSDLAYEYIESIGDIENAVSHPEYYIDEEKLRRDLYYDEESYFREEYEDEHGEDYDEDEFEREFDNYLDGLIDDIVESPSTYLGENVTAYFDYDQFGRDLALEADGGWCDDGFIWKL